MGTLPSVLIRQSSGNGNDSENKEIPNSFQSSINEISHVLQENSGHILASGGLYLKTSSHLDKYSTKKNNLSPIQVYSKRESQLSSSKTLGNLPCNSELRVTIDTSDENNISLSFPSQIGIKNELSQGNTETSGNSNATEKDREFIQSKLNPLRSLSKSFFSKKNSNLISISQGVRSSSTNNSLGFSFSPAGLLIPYHFGVVDYLKEMGLLNESSPIAGASSGSLTCVAEVSKVDMMDCLKLVNSISLKSKEKGSAGRLQEFLCSALEEILPDDIHEAVNCREGSVTIAVTEVFPLRGKFIDHFYNREDVVECLMASCNIPFYFSNWPLVRFRGKQCVDGFFAVPRSEVGCPPTHTLRKIKIVPFASRQIHSENSNNDWITPEISKKDPELLEYLKSIHLFRNSALSKASPEYTIPDSPTTMENLSTQDEPKAILLSPDLPPCSVLVLLGILPPTTFTYRFMAAPQLIKNRWQWNQILRIALEGAEEPIIQELFDLGRLDCFRWLVNEYIELDTLLLENWDLVWALLINMMDSYKKGQIPDERKSEYIFEFNNSNNEISTNFEQMEVLANGLIEKLIDARLIGPKFQHLLSNNHRTKVPN